MTGGKGLTALMTAASNASVNSMRVLLDNGADLELKDDEGNDAMQHALRMDKIESLTCASMMLMKVGAWHHQS